MKLTPTLRQDLKNYLQARLKSAQVQAHVYVAHELKADVLASIVSAHPELHHADIITHVDPSLLAGYALEIGSKRIDRSLRSRINTIFAS